MIDKAKRSRIVGEFIRQRREALGMSQRALGLLFDPPVTTQFISNVERGVTPLPPAHVPTLAKALSTSDAEIFSLLEREYASKLTGRFGKADQAGSAESETRPALIVANPDYDFMRNLYDAYRVADPKTRLAFATVCESILRVPKSHIPQ